MPGPPRTLMKRLIQLLTKVLLMIIFHAKNLRYNVVCFVFLYNFLVKFFEPYLEEELDETQRSVKLGELTSFGSSLEAVTQFDPQATMGMQFIILICFNCCQLDSVKLICWW